MPDQNDVLETDYRAALDAVRRQRVLGADLLFAAASPWAGASPRSWSPRTRPASRVWWSSGTCSTRRASPASSAPPTRRGSAHCPVLIVQGSRDKFGRPGGLRAAVKTLAAPVAIRPVEGGNHSFAVPKRSGLPQERVYATIQEEIARWVKQAAPWIEPEARRGDT